MELQQEIISVLKNHKGPLDTFQIAKSIHGSKEIDVLREVNKLTKNNKLEIVIVYSYIYNIYGPCYILGRK